MNELIGGSAFLYSTLSGDTTLSGLVTGGFHADFAPEGATYPLLRFHHQGGGDTLGGHAQRLFTEALFLVAVVGQSNGYAAIQAAASRLDSLLTVSTPQTVTIGSQSFLVRCYRERPFQLAYLANGVRFNELGGLYRCIIEPA